MRSRTFYEVISVISFKETRRQGVACIKKVRSFPQRDSCHIITFYRHIKWLYRSEGRYGRERGRGQGGKERGAGECERERSKEKIGKG